LAAIATLSAASASWIGISDIATENAFVTVKGVAATFLPWDSNQPDNQGTGGQDCVIIQTSSSKLRDESCSSKFRAVCECEP
ncbi:MAG: lectin-like protein, partial [Polyangiales bacterium]